MSAHTSLRDTTYFAAPWAVTTGEEEGAGAGTDAGAGAGVLAAATAGRLSHSGASRVQAGSGALMGGAAPTSATHVRCVRVCGILCPLLAFLCRCAVQSASEQPQSSMSNVSLDALIYQLAMAKNTEIILNKYSVEFCKQKEN